MYALANYRSERGPRAGAVVGDVLYDVAELTGVPCYDTTEAVLDDWDRAHRAIDAATGDLVTCDRASGGLTQTTAIPLSSVALLAPVPRPGAIYCVGSNYRDHAEEMRVAANRPPSPGPRERGVDPFFFIKSSHSIAGPGATVRVSDYTDQADWEIELVVVIGRAARGLTVEDALGCVAGYTVGNDLSARDLKARAGLPAESLFRADWLRHKSFDNSAPTGPWMTPADYIGDASDLRMRLWVNDGLMQDSTSANMIFSAAEQIAHLSSGITLHPGDLVMTGTPAGVGAGRNTFLHAGDTVRMDIARIGEFTFSVE